MPVYEYECSKGHRFEEWHRMENRHDAICPVCTSPGKLVMSHTSSQVALVFRVVTHDGKVLERKTGRKSAPREPMGGNLVMI